MRQELFWRRGPAAWGRGGTPASKVGTSPWPATIEAALRILEGGAACSHACAFPSPSPRASVGLKGAPCSLAAAPSLLPHRGSLASLTRSDPTFLASAAGADSLCPRVAFWLTLVSSDRYMERAPRVGPPTFPPNKSGTGLRPRPEGPERGGLLK